MTIPKEVKIHWRNFKKRPTFVPLTHAVDILDPTRDRIASDSSPGGYGEEGRVCPSAAPFGGRAGDRQESVTLPPLVGAVSASHAGPFAAQRLRAAPGPWSAGLF